MEGYRNEDELSAALNVMLRYKFGTVSWKYKDNVPMARIRKQEPVPIEVNGMPATAILYEGMLTDIRILEKNRGKTKEEANLEASFFIASQTTAAEWVSNNYPTIIAKTKEALTNGYESYSLQTGMDEKVNTLICETLKSDHGFMGAKVRRGKIIVAVNESALAEKPKRKRNRIRKAAESSQNRSESLLTSLAVNYVAEYKTRLTQLSEKARSEKNKTFSFKPLELDRDAWWYLANELKKQGYKDARVKKNKIVVVINNDYANDFDDEEFNNIF